ncbi:MAG: PadR family transcriptional regulator [Cyanobacteria bacterium P01_F01_bin.53]
MEEKKFLSLTQSQIVILASLRYHERFGLEILDAIEQNGGKRVGFNSLYPNLKKLEEKGFVTSRWDEEYRSGNKARRKYFQITGEGALALQQQFAFLESVGTWVLAPL